MANNPGGTPEIDDKRKEKATATTREFTTLSKRKGGYNGVVTGSRGIKRSGATLKCTAERGVASLGLSSKSTGYLTAVPVQREREVA